MAGQATVLEDGSRLSRLDRHLLKLEQFLALISGLARRLNPYAWGVNGLEIDHEALKIGQFAVKSCEGLTHDGTVFRVPMADPHPPAMEVPTTVKDCIVYLTVPQRRQGATEVDLSGAVR